MKSKTPSHATVVAYLALFTALGGTAIAARDDTGAKEIASFKLRESRQVADPSGRAFASAMCRQKEQYISGGYAWFSADSGVSTTRARAAGKRATGPPRGFEVASISPVPGDTLTAQAVCLPK